LANCKVFYFSSRFFIPTKKDYTGFGQQEAMYSICGSALGIHQEGGE
jgi:hypothetical protein